MKYIILVVEDDGDVLLNVKYILEHNNFQPILSRNGKSALNLLSKLESIPDLILCDIMMPEMNGYEFYSNIAANPLWNSIPFIFLTAKTEPEDIRFAKKLGVDDYITKPFKEEDLIASISGKLSRIQKNKMLREDLTEKLAPFLSIPEPPSIDEKDNPVFLFLMVWDDKIGPQLKASYPEQKSAPFSLGAVGDQLFNASIALFGQNSEYNAQGVLLRMNNLRLDAYIFFDAINEANVRGGRLQFMLGLIAPKIDYLTSLRVKESFEEISLKIKENESCDISIYWKKIYVLLPQPTSELQIQNEIL